MHTCKTRPELPLIQKKSLFICEYVCLIWTQSRAGDAFTCPIVAHSASDVAVAALYGTFPIFLQSVTACVNN